MILPVIQTRAIPRVMQMNTVFYTRTTMPAIWLRRTTTAFPTEASGFLRAVLIVTTTRKSLSIEYTVLVIQHLAYDLH